MQLSVPQRGVADSGSFPSEPDEVERWLAGLRPLASEDDAREVYRGLKHSNRLHNTPSRRRAVLARFQPVLRELHDQLVELTRAQPLPLAREFSRGAALVEALLREEAFVFKILLADSEPPDPADARRAMRAMARQAEVSAHGYRRVSGMLLRDAHALYALAEARELLGTDAEAEAEAKADAADGAAGSTPPSLTEHYAFVLLLSIVDTRQIRARQLPLALEFLRETARTIELRRLTRETPLDRRYLGVHLGRGTVPEPLASLLVDEPSELRVFDIDAPLAHVEQRIARTRSTRDNTLDVAVLERQTLSRLRVALAGTPGRRTTRIITHLAQSVVLGHREIAAHLSRAPEHRDETMTWTLENRSPHGVCLTHADCRAGAVQVGELIALDGSPEQDGSVLLGTVRWVYAGTDAAVTLGVEYLARGVLPVSVVRSDDSSSVGENALIIACRVQGTSVQTILLPPYLYESGERLVATRGERSRSLVLERCLQGNGLFGHFLID